MIGNITPGGADQVIQAFFDALELLTAFLLDMSGQLVELSPCFAGVDRDRTAQVARRVGGGLS